METTPKYFPAIFTLASSPNSPIDVADDYLYALPEHPYDWDVWLDIINQYDTYMQEKEKQPDFYARRLIDVIGLQHFATSADWMDYRNQLHVHKSSRPYDAQEEAEAMLFAQEGYTI